MGSLCALNISFLYPDHKLCFYSFGQPRTGDRTYANLFNERIPVAFRFVGKAKKLC